MQRHWKVLNNGTVIRIRRRRTSQPELEASAVRHFSAAFSQPEGDRKAEEDQSAYFLKVSNQRRGYSHRRERIKGKIKRRSDKGKVVYQASDILRNKIASRQQPMATNSSIEARARFDRSSLPKVADSKDVSRRCPIEFITGLPQDRHRDEEDEKRGSTVRKGYEDEVEKPEGQHEEDEEKEEAKEKQEKRQKRRRRWRSRCLEHARTLNLLEYLQKRQITLSFHQSPQMKELIKQFERLLGDVLLEITNCDGPKMNKVPTVRC
ncbi:hypothetical protein EAI_10378 [Harpegnathos saltator]|uniref:Uncharacterized protein n=1 Tax=Harpegnathos saltator TaxID=610380 RepID=E2B5R9_HARSA|nr:hypothetical protein EAI_10378 [Harpegnathos saltator]